MATTPSRRDVLAGGTVIGDALVAQGVVAGPAQTSPADLKTLEPRAAEDSWRRVLDDADPVWRKMPTAWFDGPFLGNGLLGSGIYAEPGANAVRFTVRHSEVRDHRPEFGSMFGLARLAVGHFTLEPVGAITAVDWRLRLREAELTGTLTTDKGTLRLRAFVHTATSVLVVRITPSQGERDFRWVFHPADPISPRAARKPVPEGYEGYEGYEANPPAVLEEHGDGLGQLTAAVQPLPSGGQYVTAWRERERHGSRTLYVSVAHSHPRTTARDRALRTVRAAALAPYDLLVLPHRVRWQRHYLKSFLSLPDARLQAFYWIQLYKAASAAREDAPMTATCGPWLESTPWPATWWNLNTRLEYWLIHGADHLELDAATGALGEFRDQHTAEAPPEAPAPYGTDSATVLRRIHDMVCRSWGGVVRVFPGVPAEWRELVLHDFRTRGAFLLSAVREEGRTRWVRVTSEAGAPCVVRHGIEGPVDVRDRWGRPLAHEGAADGSVRIPLGKGDTALITAAGDRPVPRIRPVEPNAPAARWGLPS